MDEIAITRYILETFADVHTASTDAARFFLYDPSGKFPFATIVTGDNEFDHASNLDRPGVFRLNIGVSKATYRGLFGDGPAAAAPDDGEADYDFARLDTVMPHPVYGRMHWVCVLNPSAAMFEATIRPLLAEAYAISVARHGNRADQA